MTLMMMGVGGETAPSGGAIFSLDFTGGTLPGGVTLTRASAGTYYNSSGVVTSASTDVARFTFNPATLAGPALLIEPAVTNLQPSSQNFNQTSDWNSNNEITVNPTFGTAPDGTTTSNNVTPSTNNAFHFTQKGNLSLTSNTYSISVYAKANGYNFALIQFSDATFANFVSVMWNVNTGTFSSSSNANWTITSNSIQTINNGFYRLSLVVTTNVTATISRFTLDSTGSGASFAGDGTSAVIGWGYQIEVNAVPTSYIATGNGTTVSRSADVCQFTIPGGVGHLTYTFDDNSTQSAAVSPGSFTIPTNLNRAAIKTIVGSA